MCPQDTYTFYTFHLLSVETSLQCIFFSGAALSSTWQGIKLPTPRVHKVEAWVTFKEIRGDPTPTGTPETLKVVIFFVILCETMETALLKLAFNIVISEYYTSSKTEEKWT